MVDYLEIDATTNADAAAGTPTFTGYVSSNPDVKIIVTDHGALTATFETYLNARDWVSINRGKVVDFTDDGFEVGSFDD